MAIETAISVTLNGQDVSLADGASLADLLRTQGLDLHQAGIAVAVNDRVVRRAEWESTTLGAGDQVEVITAFQGG